MPPCQGLNWQRNYETDILKREHFNIHSTGVRARLPRITIISKQDEDLPGRITFKTGYIPLPLRFTLIHGNNLYIQRVVHVPSTLLALYLDFTI